MRTFLRPIALAITLLLASTYSAGAAVGQESGFMTFSNLESGQQAVAYCENGKIDSFVVVDGYESWAVEAPLGVRCEPAALPGFMPVVNLDPRFGGWVIVRSAELDEGTEMAYACTYGGVVFAIKYPGEELYTYERDGDCGPGAMPG